MFCHGDLYLAKPAPFSNLNLVKIGEAVHDLSSGNYFSTFGYGEIDLDPTYPIIKLDL